MPLNPHFCLQVHALAIESAHLPLTPRKFSALGPHAHQVFPITGIRFYSKITAVDAAGWRSVSVSSDGFVVDTTPPEPQEHLGLGDNLIENPSFEGTEGQDDTGDFGS